MHLSQNELLASLDWNRRTPFASGIFTGSPALFAPGFSGLAHRASTPSGN